MRRLRYVAVAAAVAIAVAMAGCSKGEDGGNTKSMEEQQLADIIRQRIVGTWEHDGSCRSTAPGTPQESIFLEDGLVFTDSEHDRLTFRSDGTMTLERESDGSYIYTVDGTWELTGVPSDEEGIFPPFGINIRYSVIDRYSVFYDRFDRILFSEDYRKVYLRSYDENGTFYRYIRQ